MASGDAVDVIFPSFAGRLTLPGDGAPAFSESRRRIDHEHARVCGS
jgi:hypothetical protein